MLSHLSFVTNSFKNKTYEDMLRYSLYIKKALILSSFQIWFYFHRQMFTVTTKSSCWHLELFANNPFHIQERKGKLNSKNMMS